jgi:hypothetical protein
MKPIGLAAVLLSLVLPLPGAAEMFKNVPADRLAAAGLHKLTAAELTELEALIRNLPSPPEPANDSDGAKRPGWLRALITLQDVAASPAAVEAMESRLAGNYDGWNGRTVFRLENGQVWQQNDSSSRIDSVRPSPAVKIYPGMLGVYWLEIEGINQRVKVKPVKLR